MIDLRNNFELEKVMLINFTNLTDEEKEIIRNYRNHENIRKWMYSDYIISPEEHIRFIEKLKNDDKNFYWIVKTKQGEYIGVIYLNKVNSRNKNAYIGIYSNPEKTDVGGILMDCLKELAFEIADFHTLKLEVIESNQRAIDFYKRSGFIEEGRLKEFVFKGNKWLGVIVMGIINKDKS